MKTKCDCPGCVADRTKDQASEAKRVLMALRTLDRDFLTQELQKMEAALKHENLPALLSEGIQSQHTDFTVLLQSANAVHERCMDQAGCMDLLLRIMQAAQAKDQEGGNHP